MDNFEEERPRRRPRKKKSILPRIILAIVALAAIAGIAAAVINYMPNYQVVDYFDYHTELNKSNIQLILEGETMRPDNYPVIKNDEIYLPVDFIKDHVDKYIFWDAKTGKLTITTEYRVLRMKTDELTGYVNENPFSLNLAVYDIGDTAYMPKVFLEELYNISISHSEDYNIVYVDYIDKDMELAKTQPKNTYLRYEPDKKSPSMEKLPAGTEVSVYETAGDAGEFTKVRTEKGLIGYVSTKSLDGYSTQPGYSKEDIVPDLKEPKPIEGKINLVWDQLNANENDSESSRTYHNGLDVLSPTWFKFDRESYSGDMISIADLGYVNWAHDNGYQVWALISDEEDGEVTAQILSDQLKREHVIKQILAYVSMYGLDGINIDFERVREADVEYFHQFLRELWPMLRAEGVTLSVDTFVPSAWSMYYNRAEIAKTVDYICVMTYDENTYGGTSGPNASIGFVENGVVNTLNEVPKEKLLMGIPYYSRVWIEEPDGSEVNYRIRSLGMNYAYRLFTENGAEFEWLEDLGCYYGEFETVENGKNVKYRTWLEDENSISEKLKLVDKYDLAGVCAWVRGLEKQEIWDVLSDSLKN